MREARPLLRLGLRKDVLDALKRTGPSTPERAHLEGGDEGGIDYITSPLHRKTYINIYT